MAQSQTKTKTAIETVKIGAIYALTGDIGTYGQESVKGIRLAVAELNARKDPKYDYKLFVEDNRSDARESANAIKKLISINEVIAVLGSVASNLTMAASPVAQAKKIPLVSTGSTNEKITKQGDYIFRTCFVDDFQGTATAKFARQDLKVKKAAVVIERGNAYSEGIAVSFSKTFKDLGGEIIEDDFSYQAKQKDFRSLLRRVQRKNPDAIYIPGYYSEVGLILKQAKELRMDGPFIGSDGWASPTLLELAGEKAAAGHYLTSHFAPDMKEPKVQAFVRKYSEAHQVVPGAFAALAYDGMRVLAEAIEKSSEVKSPLIRDQLAKIQNHAGVTGNITIDENRNARKSAVVLRTSKDGFEFLTRIEPDAPRP